MFRFRLFLIAALALSSSSARAQSVGLGLEGARLGDPNGPMSIAIVHDAGPTTAAEMQAIVDLVLAERVRRNFRGIHHSGNYIGSGAASDPARVAALNVLKAIPPPLSWALGFGHFDGDQNGFGVCTGGLGPDPENVCDSGGFTTDLGGTGAGFQYSALGLWRAWTGIEVPNVPGGEDTSDVDIFYHATAYPWRDKGVVVLHVPWSANNSSAFDTALDEIEAELPGWPVMLVTHSAMKHGGNQAGDPFDRTAPWCLAAPQDTPYLWQRDSVFMIQASHCPTSPSCTSKANPTGKKVIGCVGDWFFHRTAWEDAGDFFSVEIDCPADAVTVRTLDPIDNSQVGAGCDPFNPPESKPEEVDLLGATCCDYTPPYGPSDPGCTEAWTFAAAGLQARGMCGP